MVFRRSNEFNHSHPLCVCVCVCVCVSLCVSVCVRVRADFQANPLDLESNAYLPVKYSKMYMMTIMKKTFPEAFSLLSGSVLS